MVGLKVRGLGFGVWGLCLGLSGVGVQGSGVGLVRSQGATQWDSKENQPKIWSKLVGSTTCPCTEQLVIREQVECGIFQSESKSFVNLRLDSWHENEWNDLRRPLCGWGRPFCRRRAGRSHPTSPCRSPTSEFGNQLNHDSPFATKMTGVPRS